MVYPQTTTTTIFAAEFMFHPCPFGPKLLVLRNDKNVLGSRKKQVGPLMAKSINNDKTGEAVV